MHLLLFFEACLKEKNISLLTSPQPQEESVTEDKDITPTKKSDESKLSFIDILRWQITHCISQAPATDLFFFLGLYLGKFIVL